MATTDKTSADAPDLTAIFDNLFIGNLASATTLRDHPELGITHVLSVCPEYPETSPSPNGEPSAGVTRCPTVAQPRHRCIPIQDSEYEDILIHLPSAIAFIKDALDSSQSEATASKDGETCVQERVDAKPNVTARERSYVASIRKPKVLVHCVMGISRSTTVVCAYLMATRHLSFPAALMLIRRRRPQVHPNYGFRRQLTIFAVCDYFTDFPAPVSYHPAHTAWMRKRKREAGRYLTRVGDVVEIKLKDSEDVALSITDDFPTDPAEASCLLSEVEATHFLSISPASLPPLPPPPPSPVVSPILKPGRRPPVFACPSISASSSSGSSVNSSPGSAFSSPPSSRSSSFSFAHQLSSLSGPSTAATSVTSIPSLLPPSKLRLEASLDDVEPNFLALAGVKHHHVAIPGSSPVDLLVRLNETASFIKRAFGEDEDCSSDSGCSSWDSGSESASETKRRTRDVGQRRHVLIHCTTESRACAVVCAYLMSSRGLTPSQAYNVLEEGASRLFYYHVSLTKFILRSPPAFQPNKILPFSARALPRVRMQSHTGAPARARLARRRPKEVSSGTNAVRCGIPDFKQSTPAPARAQGCEHALEERFRRGGRRRLGVAAPEARHARAVWVLHEPSRAKCADVPGHEQPADANGTASTSDVGGQRGADGRGRGPRGAAATLRGRGEPRVRVRRGGVPRGAARDRGGREDGQVMRVRSRPSAVVS
ncbi:hypothetical protein DFH11DRAFT_1238621 [Phellopilus nigrolimitatus]|nr:hypothetical protein DFH11DRAFT_1238621 [Phellopilus nigrolimitatus]